VIVRKVAEREDTNLESPVSMNHGPASYEPKQRAIFLVTRPVEDSIDDTEFKD
jgi:hypothetical protein